MNDYEIIDNDLYKDYKYLNEVIEYTFEKLKITNTTTSIIFVDNEEIQSINKQYRNIDKITDVISFAFEDNKEIGYNTMCRALGDIYICIPKMKEQASDYKHSEKRELSFLTVHGLLHLLGYDHMNEEEESEMFELQELILNAKEIKR